LIGQATRFKASEEAFMGQLNLARLHMPAVRGLDPFPTPFSAGFYFLRVA